MALTTKEIVKAELGNVAATWDATIDRMIAAVDLWLAQHCRRIEHGVSLVERQVSRVEYPEAIGPSVLYLRCYPVESIAEIVQATDEAFGAATPLVAGTDYTIDPNVGGRVVSKRGIFYTGVKEIRSTYNGGYYTGVGALPGGARALPGHIAQASTRMVCHVFTHKDKFGERSINVGDMNIAEIKDGLLGIARELLDGEVSWAA